MNSARKSHSGDKCKDNECSPTRNKIKALKESDNSIVDRLLNNPAEMGGMSLEDLLQYNYNPY